MENWIDWIGYIASFVVLVSLLMTSIAKLRWINLVGCLIFGYYGLLIGSIPTAIMNLGIVFINIYYLVKLYNIKEEFTLVKADVKSDYFKHFMKNNSKDIEYFFGASTIDETKDVFYILRNNNIAGIIVGEIENLRYNIVLDYVIPEYRDFKLGDNFYNKDTSFFKDLGVDELIATSTSKEHENYLLKVGFKKENNKFIKKI